MVGWFSLHKFIFDCDKPLVAYSITLKSVPGPNQYYAKIIKFLSKRNNA